MLGQSLRLLLACCLPWAGGQLVTTLAGAGVAGASDSVGRGASFDILAALAFDTSRQLLWVADGSLIRTVSPGGIVTTVAGRAGVASRRPANVKPSALGTNLAALPLMRRR